MNRKLKDRRDEETEKLHGGIGTTRGGNVLGP